MRQDMLVNALQKSESVYILDDYEEAVLRISPNSSLVKVYIKYRGCKETEISSNSEIASKIILAGTLINEDLYNQY